MGSLAPIKPHSELREGTATAPVVIGILALIELRGKDYGAFWGKQPEFALEGHWQDCPNGQGGRCGRRARMNFR
jgi:hypothetical protein